MTNISRQPTPYKARKSVVSGFTLIELLVVMVIISIIITATLLSMHRLMQNRQAVTVAKQLAQVIPAAQQEAILQLAPFGLKISEHRYQFYRFDIKANSTNGSWHLLKQDRVLANKTLSSKIFLSLKTQAETAEKNQQTPQIIFFTEWRYNRF